MEDYDRMERRERDKQERAKKSLIQNTEPEFNIPLFSEPKRVSQLHISVSLLDVVC